MEKITRQTKKYKTVSLFSGIGGFDLAFEYSGFDMVWANEIDSYAVKTFQHNVGDYIVQGDIKEKIDEVPIHDVLIAGFPCQPFSMLGNLSGFDDVRGGLFFEIVKIIKKHSPKAIVLENVANILKHDKGKTFEKIENELTSEGYVVHKKILNSADFGIPQRRNRAFIVALKKESFIKIQDFEFPKVKELNLTLQDLLDEEVEEKYFLSMRVSKTILENNNSNFKHSPVIDQPIAKTLTATMAKMHRASQDNYVTDEKNYERVVDKTKNKVRKLTPNECRKLQGFPSGWQQVVSNCQAYKQFGNSICVDVAYFVAQNLMCFIENNLKNDI